MSLEEQVQLEDAYVMHTFGRKPVQLVEGSGMTVVDDKGNEYLDFIGGIGVISLGHCHPELVKTVAEQAARLMHVSNYYYIEGRGQLAEQLSCLLNDASGEGAEPWQTFFANSGAEANECAIKLARLHARRTAQAAGKAEPPRTIVTLQRSFHGRTLATLAATAQPAKQEAFQPLPDGFVATPANDVAALEELFATQGESICGMLCEPVQGEAGVYPCSKEFLQAARRLCSEYGALLMFDEVQCGMFRCGAPFAFQRYGVIPDVVSMAKGIGGGFPMGACAARASIASAFEPGDHGSTFGGSNLAVASALTVLRVAAQENLAANAEEVGSYLREKLAELPGVVAVRGLGLMNAADLAEDIDAHEVVANGLQKGLLLNATGVHTLRFLPPLVCTRRDVDVLVERLAELL
ncbi:MAG: aspartate aminotransferase family protein [Eggerthellaceae bacterium]|nr:aspartate aminotransferase family protein [Eggerthellaceae bacterium]